MGGQVMIPSAADAWSIAIFGLALVIAGGGVIWASFAATTERYIMQGLGMIAAGVSVMVATLGVHSTPLSSPLDWLWVGILFSGTTILFACCYGSRPRRPAPPAGFRRYEIPTSR